jgi:hypothetical protein
MIPMIMMLIDFIKEYVYGLPPELGVKITEKKEVFTLELVVAERKAFLSKKKLIYVAKFHIYDAEKRITFTELLKEFGSGIGGGDLDSPGFGFKVETYNTVKKPRQGTIQELSTLFGKNYQYNFNFKEIRENFEQMALNVGYRFEYQITAHSL